MKQTPMYQLYARLAPKPADWPQLLTKLGQMLGKDYDWSKDVAVIKSPTLLVFGDADAVRTEHAVKFFELLGGGKKDGAGTDQECRPRVSPSWRASRTIQSFHRLCWLPR